MAKARVLIVEDEVLIAETMRVKLTRLGYEIAHMAMSGEEALQVLDDADPDLVLMDIRLAGELDGVQTAAQVRQRMQVPIIFVTAYSDDATLERVKKISPYGYIIKPFQVNDLRTNIELALHRFAAEQEQQARQQGQLNSVMRYIEDALVLTDTLGRVVFINPMAETLCGTQQSDAVGRRIDELFPLRTQHGPYDVLSAIQGVVRHDANAPLPDGLQLVHNLNLPLRMVGQLVPVHSDDGTPTGVLVSMREMGAPVATDASTPLSLMSQVLELQDKGRFEMAHSLHESLGQILSAAKMNLESMRPQANEPQLEKSKQLLDDAVVRVRKLTQSIMPSMLADFGLLPALDAYFRRLHTEQQLVVKIEAGANLPRYGQSFEYSLFRITQNIISCLADSGNAGPYTVSIAEKTTPRQVKLRVLHTVPHTLLPDLSQPDDSPKLMEIVARLKVLGGTIVCEAIDDKRGQVLMQVPLE